MVSPLFSEDALQAYLEQMSQMSTNKDHFEVAGTANPDIFVEWRQANDPDLSMVGSTLAHADFPPGCTVVVNPPNGMPPQPVHFDDSEHTWVDGAAANSLDIETVALQEIGHCLGLQHTTVTGSVMSPTVSPSVWTPKGSARNPPTTKIHASIGGHSQEVDCVTGRLGHCLRRGPNDRGRTDDAVLALDRHGDMLAVRWALLWWPGYRTAMQLTPYPRKRDRFHPRIARAAGSSNLVQGHRSLPEGGAIGVSPHRPSRWLRRRSRGRSGQRNRSVSEGRRYNQPFARLCRFFSNANIGMARERGGNRAIEKPLEDHPGARALSGDSNPRVRDRLRRKR
jgi:hypothetical protein